MFSSRSFNVSGLIFRSLIHFEFIFVYGVRKCSSFILLQVVDQSSQHHLLKRLSFFHWGLLTSVSKWGNWVPPEIFSITARRNSGPETKGTHLAPGSSQWPSDLRGDGGAEKTPSSWVTSVAGGEGAQQWETETPAGRLSPGPRSRLLGPADGLF